MDAFDLVEDHRISEKSWFTSGGVVIDRLLQL
jgi:hypothetical protein